MRAILLLLLALSGVMAQSLPRREAGVHLVVLNLDSIAERPGGAGALVSYRLNRFVHLEGEVNRYFEDPSGNFGHTQVLAGARYGYWFGPFGIFAKARPGLLHLGGGTAARNPGRENNAVFDLGGVILVGRRRASLRIEAGDTIVFWGSQPFAIGCRARSQETIAS